MRAFRCHFRSGVARVFLLTLSLGLLSAAVAARSGNQTPRNAKVYTNDDLSRLPRNALSVVGRESTTPAAPSSDSGSKAPGARAASPSEQEWRDRAHELQQRVAVLDAEIARVRENIANAPGRGYEIHTDVLDLSLADLLAEKVRLEKRVDQLRDDARKAGADPGWVR